MSQIQIYVVYLRGILHIDFEFQRFIIIPHGTWYRLKTIVNPVIGASCGYKDHRYYASGYFQSQFFCHDLFELVLEFCSPALFWLGLEFRGPRLLFRLR